MKRLFFTKLAMSLLVLFLGVACYFDTTAPVPSLRMCQTLSDNLDWDGGYAVGFPSNTKGKVYILERTITFSAINSLTSSDVAYVLNIPAGSMVTNVMAFVTTASTDSGDPTIDLGYGGTANYWQDGTDFSTTGNSGASTANPAYFASDDTIDLTVNTTVDDGVVVVRAIVYDLN